MNYFSADTHFGHTNIIKHCNRPFKTADDMNDVMLTNINDMVGEDDTYWHLGDFAWGDPWPFLNAIRCKDIRIIIGNHDKHRRKQLEDAHTRGRIKLHHGYLDTKIDGQFLTMCHFPMLSWQASFHRSWHLYGHVHGTIDKPRLRSMDVGVDAHDFCPISWTYICEFIENQVVINPM